MTGRWEMVKRIKRERLSSRQPQTLGLQNYPALRSKKAKVENTTRKTLEAKDPSSLSTEYAI